MNKNETFKSIILQKVSYVSKSLIRNYRMSIEPKTDP